MSYPLLATRLLALSETPRFISRCEVTKSPKEPATRYSLLATRYPLACTFGNAEIYFEVRGDKVAKEEPATRYSLLATRYPLACTFGTLRFISGAR